MPKENTHLYLAEKILEKIEHPDIKKIIQDNLYFYKLGSFSPDVFSYGKDKPTTQISKDIHGFNDKRTNEIVFAMLDKIEKKDKKNLAFIFGFLTHLAADITFHPMIFYITGDAETPKSLYQHVAFETGLDKFFHKKFIIPKFNRKKIDQLIFLKILEKDRQITRKELVNNYRRQFQYSILFKIKSVYSILKILNKLRLFKQIDKLGLFYADKFYPKDYFKQTLIYHNPVSNKQKNVSIRELQRETSTLAIKYIETAFAYYQKETSRHEAEEIIQGNNLCTGKVDFAASDIKFFDSKSP